MNRLLAGLGMLVVFGGLFLLVAPVSHIPLLDANRAVLAESERDGVCAGKTYAETQGRGSVEAMAECNATSSHNPAVDHLRVQPGFCVGLISAGFPITQSKCLDVMEGQQLWPLMTGGLTNSWNRRFPYPGGLLKTIVHDSNESRTGDRESTDRQGFDRSDAPPTTMEGTE